MPHAKTYHTHTHQHTHVLGSSPSPSPIGKNQVCMLPYPLAGLTQLPGPGSCSDYGGTIVSKNKYVSTCSSQSDAKGTALTQWFMDDATPCAIAGQTGSPSTFGAIGSICTDSYNYPPSGSEAFCTQ
jgi:hypothetical protein